jgi:BirA family biotin operon repressor/biotin-[acetyl-CoA-carboxylase] ligase
VKVEGAAGELYGDGESIDESGALHVRTDEGALRRVLSGDVSVRGVMGYV